MYSIAKKRSKQTLIEVGGRKDRDCPKALHLGPHLLLGLLLFLLFTEDSPAHCEHSFEPFPSFTGVLGETAITRLLDSILDLLPPTTQSRDLGVLYKLCTCGGKRLVDDSFAYAEDIRESEVGRDHRDFFRLRIHIGCLKDVGCVCSAH